VKQPTQDAARFTMLRLSLAINAAEQVEEALLRASQHLVSLLAQTYFMPFGVTFLSLLSRSLVLHHQLRADLASLYDHTARLIPALPEMKPTAAASSAVSRDFGWLAQEELPPFIRLGGVLKSQVVAVEEAATAMASQHAGGSNGEASVAGEKGLGEDLGVAGEDLGGLVQRAPLLEPKPLAKKKKKVAPATKIKKGITKKGLAKGSDKNGTKKLKKKAPFTPAPRRSPRLAPAGAPS